jgi:chromosome segregation ATPase
VLKATAAAIEDAAAVLRLLPDHIATARRSQTDWAGAVTNWQREAEALHEAAERAESAAAISRAARTELTTAEAALGEEPEHVAVQVEETTARRDGLAADLDAARASHTTAVGAAATARAEAGAAEQSATDAEQEQSLPLDPLLEIGVEPLIRGTHLLLDLGLSDLRPESGGRVLVG